jgi:hypothetical protein
MSDIVLSLVARYATTCELATVWTLLNKNYANPETLNAIWKAAFERRARRILNRTNQRLPPGIRLDYPIGIIASPVILGSGWWPTSSPAPKTDEPNDKSDIKKTDASDPKRDSEEWIRTSRFSSWRVRKQNSQCGVKSDGERWCWRDRWSILGFLCVSELREYAALRDHRSKNDPNLTTEETMNILMHGQAPKAANAPAANELLSASARRAIEGEYVKHGTFAKDGWGIVQRQSVEKSVVITLLRSVVGPDRLWMALLLLIPAINTIERWKTALQLKAKAKAAYDQLLQIAGRGNATDDVLMQLSKAATSAGLPQPDECIPRGIDPKTVRIARELAPADKDMACHQHGFDVACGCVKALPLAPDNPYSCFSSAVIEALALNPCVDLKSGELCDILLSLWESAGKIQGSWATSNIPLCLAAHGDTNAVLSLIAQTSRLRRDSYHGSFDIERSAHGVDPALHLAALGPGLANCFPKDPARFVKILKQNAAEEIAATSRVMKATQIVTDERAEQQKRKKARTEYRKLHPPVNHKDPDFDEDAKIEGEPEWGVCDHLIRTRNGCRVGPPSAADQEQTGALAALSNLNSFMGQSGLCGRAGVSGTDAVAMDQAMDHKSPVSSYDSFLSALQLLLGDENCWARWENDLVHGSVVPIRLSAVKILEEETAKSEPKEKFDPSSRWNQNGALEVAERVASLLMPWPSTGITKLIDRMARICLGIIKGDVNSADAKLIPATEAKAVSSTDAKSIAAANAKSVAGADAKQIPSTDAKLVRATYVLSCLSRGAIHHRHFHLQNLSSSQKEILWSPSLETEVEAHLTKISATKSVFFPATANHWARKGALHVRPLTLESDVRWLLEASQDLRTSLLCLNLQPDLQYVLKSHGATRCSDLVSFDANASGLMMKQLVLRTMPQVQKAVKGHLLGPHLPSQCDLTGWAQFSRYYFLVRDVDRKHEMACVKKVEDEERDYLARRPNEASWYGQQIGQKRLFMHALILDVCDIAPVARIRPFPGSLVASTYNDWIHAFREIEGKYDPAALPLFEGAKRHLTEVLTKFQVEIISEEEYNMSALGIIHAREPRTCLYEDRFVGEDRFGADLLFATSGSFGDEIGLTSNDS